MHSNYNTTERGIRSSQNPNAAGAAGGIPPSQLQPTYGSSRVSGPAPTTAGHHTHDILNKLDPRVDSTHDNQPLPQQQQQPVHSSKLANALDPRVDSRSANAALDNQRAMMMSGGSAAPGVGAGGHAGMGGGGGLGSSSSHHAAAGGMMGGAGAGPREGTYGPHSSRAANAMDPRVDSDLDSSGMRTGHAVGGGYTPGFGSGAGINHHHHGNAAAAGGPNSAISGGGGSGMGGYNTQGTTAGYGSGGGLGGGAGGMMSSNHNQQRGHLPGPAPNTAGPHRSDLLNKLDPRVDSKGTGTTGGGLGGNAGTGSAGGLYRGDDVRRGI